MMAVMTAVVTAVMTTVMTAVMTAVPGLYREGCRTPRTPPGLYREGENYHKSFKRRCENPEMSLLEAQRLIILS